MKCQIVLLVVSMLVAVAMRGTSADPAQAPTDMTPADSPQKSSSSNNSSSSNSSSTDSSTNSSSSNSSSSSSGPSSDLKKELKELCKKATAVWEKGVGTFRDDNKSKEPESKGPEEGKDKTEKEFGKLWESMLFGAYHAKHIEPEVVVKELARILNSESPTGPEDGSASTTPATPTAGPGGNQRAKRHSGGHNRLPSNKALPLQFAQLFFEFRKLLETLKHDPKTRSAFMEFASAKEKLIKEEMKQ